MAKNNNSPSIFLNPEWSYQGDQGDELFVKYYFNDRTGQVGIHYESGQVDIFSRERWAKENPSSPFNTLELIAPPSVDEMIQKISSGDFSLYALEEIIDALEKDGRGKSLLCLWLNELKNNRDVIRSIRTSIGKLDR